MCDLCKSRILFVLDDDPVQLQVLDLLLESEGYKAVCFITPAELLDSALKLTGPATFLLDFNIPGHNVVELCEFLRMHVADARIVAMSAGKIGRRNSQCFDAFVQKPAGLAQLRLSLCACSPVPATNSFEPNGEAQALDERIFANLARSMKAAALDSLYSAYFADAGRRLNALELALEAENINAYQQAAHALKGASGMLGLTQVAAAACCMESEPLLTAHSSALLARTRQDLETARLQVAATLRDFSDDLQFPPFSVPLNASLNEGKV